ncbi:PREDICTED: cyclin-dependent kinase 4 isoform X2 [Nicrophorus vespilloides]|nr:PREDICTED: cyclin-dependent kinase 4 isoform X2 [Nicrophorus vespilloides]
MELVKNSNNYEEMHIIGTGAYGMVYKARDKTSNKMVALKKVKVPLTDDGIPLNTLREIALLKQLDVHEHPNIVRLLDICHGQRLEKELIMFLVFEHLEYDLSMYLEKRSMRNFLEKEIRQMSKEILCGVEFLHSHRIIHRDLKPQNILVTTEGRIKLADFGLAKTYDFDMRLTKVVVTLWYRAPEVLLELSYATPVDIWSVGCIIAELYSLKPLFSGNSEVDQLNRIFRVLGKPLQSEWPKENMSIRYDSFEILDKVDLKDVVPNLSENGYNLIMSMLTFDPMKRNCAFKALQHDYFTEEPLNC